MIRFSFLIMFCVLNLNHLQAQTFLGTELEALIKQLSPYITAIEKNVKGYQQHLGKIEQWEETTRAYVVYREVGAPAHVRLTYDVQHILSKLATAEKTDSLELRHQLGDLQAKFWQVTQGETELEQSHCPCAQSYQLDLDIDDKFTAFNSNMFVEVYQEYLTSPAFRSLKLDFFDQSTYIYYDDINDYWLKVDVKNGVDGAFLTFYQENYQEKTKPTSTQTTPLKPTLSESTLSFKPLTPLPKEHSNSAINFGFADEAHIDFGSRSVAIRPDFQSTTLRFTRKNVENIELSSNYGQDLNRDGRKEIIHYSNSDSISKNSFELQQSSDGHLLSGDSMVKYNDLNSIELKQIVDTDKDQINYHVGLAGGTDNASLKVVGAGTLKINEEPEANSSQTNLLINGQITPYSGLHTSIDYALHFTDGTPETHQLGTGVTYISKQLEVITKATLKFSESDGPTDASSLLQITGKTPDLQASTTFTGTGHRNDNGTPAEEDDIIDLSLESTHQGTKTFPDKKKIDVIFNLNMEKEREDLTFGSSNLVTIANDDWKLEISSQDTYNFSENEWNSSGAISGKFGPLTMFAGANFSMDFDQESRLQSSSGKAGYDLSTQGEHTDATISLSFSLENIEQHEPTSAFTLSGTIKY